MFQHHGLEQCQPYDPLTRPHQKLAAPCQLAPLRSARLHPVLHRARHALQRPSQRLHGVTVEKKRQRHALRQRRHVPLKFHRRLIRLEAGLDTHVWRPAGVKGVGASRRARQYRLLGPLQHISGPPLYRLHEPREPSQPKPCPAVLLVVRSAPSQRPRQLARRRRLLNEHLAQPRQPTLAPRSGRRAASRIHLGALR